MERCANLINFVEHDNRISDIQGFQGLYQLSWHRAYVSTAMAFYFSFIAHAADTESVELAAKRFGLPSEFGDACAFLCSAQAGFISGQNLQLDGGSYEGLI